MTPPEPGPAPEGTIVPVDLTNIRDPKLKRFYQYWLEKRGERRMPSRRDIDPVDFPYVLGNLMLIDVLRDPLRFRVRLHGINVVQRMHFDMTGKLLDEIPHPQWREYTIERCGKLAESGEALLLNNDLYLDGLGSRYEALWVPLSDDGVEVTLLICGLSFAELASAAP